MLQATDLVCERGERVLFRGLSLSLEPGELLRVAGSNGRGKTSLLRILCGLLAPAQGEVRWKGAPIRELREDYGRELVYVGHAAAVKDDLTAAENLSISCRLGGARCGRQAVLEALHRFSVPHDVFLKRLSQGQRRRAALARLLLSDAAPLWLLDEPFVALDAAASALVEALIRAHVASGGMAVYTTHQGAGIQAPAARLLDLEPEAAIA
ncbi:MAG TPA: cytochrome c biogenesis heme-transporting ATPase CcmA [Burkholderiales bacterium]|nr:cytochrome c biogenesis heme-transporting ATPase CcmA [Burkholderiales bacterium]